MITIDGSKGEGGGQIVRTATGLAALLRQPVHVKRIREGRRKPGLAAQHVAGVRALCRLTGGQAKGLEAGSTELFFTPGSGMKKDLTIDVKTAGAITLILQGVLIALGRSQRTVRLRLKGGTDVAWSPPFMYFSSVMAPLLERMGFQIRTRLIRPGFYPKGGGDAEVSVRAPLNILPINLESPHNKIATIRAFTISSKDLRKARVAERILTGVRSSLPEVKGDKVYVDSFSTGCSVVLTADFGDVILGSDALGERGIPAEEVGTRAARQLKSQIQSGASVDIWASDQILPFMALSEKNSSFFVDSVTSHAATNMEVISKFLQVKFVVEKGDVPKIRCMTAV